MRNILFIVSLGLLLSCSNNQKKGIGTHLVYADSGMHKLNENKLPISTQNNKIVILTDKGVFCIPQVINLDNTIPYAGIYRITKDSIIKNYGLLYKNLIYFTVFDTSGRGYTNLYVFNIVKNKVVADLELKHNYLYSAGGKFIIDTTANKLFAISEPTLFGKSNNRIMTASMYSIDGINFKFFKNIYQEDGGMMFGNGKEDDTVVMKFYYKSLIDNGKNGHVLPKNWWKL